MKFLLLTISIFVLQPVIRAQQNTASGIITDARTNSGLEGATVHNYTTAETVLTNDLGIFLFRSAVSFSDTILISAIGFEPVRITYEELSKRKTLSLIQKAITLKELTLTSNPANTSQIISKLDIRMRGINNSQEALRMIPGLFIGQHAGGGKAEQIFLRGFDIDHGTDISISVDGMPVNMVSHAHGQGYADLHFIIPELVDNVAFRKGTYYPEKGNFTTSGYVDFKTINVLPANSVKVEGGMFNTVRGVGQFNLLSQKAREKQQSLFIASEYIQTDGYFDNPQDFKRYNIFGKYYGKLNNNNLLSFSASTFKSSWNASGQIPDRAVESKLIPYFGAIDPNEGGETSRSNATTVLSTTLPDGSLLKNQVFYSRYNFELYSNFTFYKEDPVNGDQIRQKEARDIYGYNGSYTKVNYAGKTKITSELGTNLRLDRTNKTELSRTKDRELTTEVIKLGDISESNISAYVSETFTFNPKFTINTGVRYDQFFAKYKDRLNNNNIGQAVAGTLSPKLNFYYQADKNTQLYLTSGKGFHSNDTRVVVPQNGLQILPAAYGSDLGVTTKIGKDFFLNAALWYLYLKQEFVYVGDEGVVEPSGRSRRLGLDVSARYQPVQHLFFDVDFNYSRGRSVDNAKGENYLPLAPAFTSIGGITFKSNKNINASLRYRYMANRPANEDYSITAKGYFVSDMFLNYTKKKFEVGLTVQNLFNVRWKETQFDTESQLKNEGAPVSEIHFTPGTPFFLKAAFTYFF